MKFAHIADCHLDAWRDSKLKELCTAAFEQAIDTCISEKVDFVLICGDLFNTALPSIDSLKVAVKKFEELKQKGIPVYIIPGSHDVTHAGKSMLDVLEEAKLVTNVVRGTVEDGMLRLAFTTDKKTGVKLAGMLGRRGMLEKAYYEQLDVDALEAEQGEKIFLFHTAIDELKLDEHLASTPLSLLPKGFDYYAGGHVHMVMERSFAGYNKVVYPGPLFPNSFSELEELTRGGFFIVDNGELIRKDIALKPVVSIRVAAEHSTPEKVTEQIRDQLEHLADAIVLIRVEGCLAEGKTSDVDFTALTKIALDKGAYAVLRNTVKFTSVAFTEFKNDYRTAEDLEHAFLKEHVGQVQTGLSAEDEINLAKQLMHVLSLAREDGEKVYTYDEKIRVQGKRALRLDDA